MEHSAFTVVPIEGAAPALPSGEEAEEDAASTSPSWLKAAVPAKTPVKVWRHWNSPPETLHNLMMLSNDPETSCLGFMGLNWRQQIPAL